MQEVGVFEMTDEGIYGVTDYSSLFLSETRGIAAGAGVTPAETGKPRKGGTYGKIGARFV